MKLINRRSAITALTKQMLDGTDYRNEIVGQCIGAIKELKVHDSKERKKGKWVLVHPLQEDDGGAYICSCCGTGCWEIDPESWKACPWCTALMEVDE